MCGIVGIFDIEGGAEHLRKRALLQSGKIRHRGPDWSGIYVGKTAVLAHERLSIVDPKSGSQPLKTKEGDVILAVNGEIYNHREIREKYAEKFDFQTGSDCEVILALYKDKGIDFLEDLSGIFAFALYDEAKNEYLIARDPIGVIPLYIGKDADGHLCVASELKALEGFCTEYEVFLPGHYYSSKTKKMTKWYNRKWTSFDTVRDSKLTSSDIREALENAVQRQLMSDVPYGVLLSGGLDSSIISAVAKKYSAMRVETGNTQQAWWPQLHSFAVGLKGAPDLKAAKEVADYIGTVHHEINYT
ncbi:MAG: asparagine synthase (glutamine-hydrolyzing), partial [Bacteroidales bacterium]|nr:asparagine synthase (glutamine-hydrolyzing) [Bacteroidales bacterium]